MKSISAVSTTCASQPARPSVPTSRQCNARRLQQNQTLASDVAHTWTREQRDRSRLDATLPLTVHQGMASPSGSIRQTGFCLSQTQAGSLCGRMLLASMPETLEYPCE